MLAFIKNKNAESRIERSIAKNLQQVTGKINSKIKKPSRLSRDGFKSVESDHLFIICFASMLSVACGTALNLALSISLPVTRQMP